MEERIGPGDVTEHAMNSNVSSEKTVVRAPSTSRKRSRWRELQIVLGITVLLGCAVTAYYYYATITAERRLQKAFAEADRLDPGWRLDDLLKSRPIIPDEDNAALHRMAVSRMLPGGKTEIGASLQKVRPEAQLNADLTKVLRTKLKDVSTAVEAARKLAHMSKACEPITMGANGLPNLLPVDDSWDVAKLLSSDAALLAQDGEFDKATISCCAILNSGRSLGVAPFLMASLARETISRDAVESLERILAQGQPTEAALADLQFLLENEAAHPTCLNMLRAYRAGSDRKFEDLEAGRTKIIDIVPATSLSGLQLGRFTPDRFYYSLRSGSIKNNRAAHLECCTLLIEAYKLPRSERLSRMKEITAQIEKQPWLARQFWWLAASPRYTQKMESVTALVGAAAVAVAAERYRLAHARWPDSLEALVTQYLAEVPNDPFADGPLRLRRVDFGLIIYSVGPDGVDNGGNVGTAGSKPGTNIRFRLWDVKRRRQPAAEAEAERSKPSRSEAS